MHRGARVLSTLRNAHFSFSPKIQAKKIRYDIATLIIKKLYGESLYKN
jgi:hypothetical protein